MKISNRNARCYVMDRKPFTANNIFAEIVNDVYIVYSYGYHFPMYVNFDGVWYENADKYSVTTSKHKNQARPLAADTVITNTETLKNIINNLTTSV